MKNSLKRLAPAVALCVPFAVLAQTAASGPGTAGALAPQLTYRSAFADYKPWQDTKAGDWRAMNDAVAKSGGHVMAMPMGGASAPAPAASKPAMVDHSGHQMPMSGDKK